MLTKYLTIFLISMIPMVELRGAIPFAMGMNLPVIPSYIICIIGNLITLPFIYFFATKILNWGKNKKYIGKFFTYCLDKGKSLGTKMQNKMGGGLFLAIALFVGVPIPGTGAWTATLAASLLGVKFKVNFFAALVGVSIAGVIMMLGSIGVFALIK